MHADMHYFSEKKSIVSTLATCICETPTEWVVNQQVCKEHVMHIKVAVHEVRGRIKLKEALINATFSAKFCMPLYFRRLRYIFVYFFLFVQSSTVFDPELLVAKYRTVPQRLTYKRVSADLLSGAENCLSTRRLYIIYSGIRIRLHTRNGRIAFQTTSILLRLVASHSTSCVNKR